MEKMKMVPKEKGKRYSKNRNGIGNAPGSLTSRKKG